MHPSSKEILNLRIASNIDETINRTQDSQLDESAFKTQDSMEKVNIETTLTFRAEENMKQSPPAIAFSHLPRPSILAPV